MYGGLRREMGDRCRGAGRGGGGGGGSRGEMCEVDCGQNRQKTTNGVRGRGKKAGGEKTNKKNKT